MTRLRQRRLIDLPVYLARRLQSALSAAAQLIFNLRRSDHASNTLNPSPVFTDCVFLSAPGPKLPSWYTMCSTAVHRRTLARLLTLPAFQVAEALPAATASFSLRFTAPLLAAEHFRLLALSCGTACHRRLRRHRLWRPSAVPHSTQNVPVYGIIF